MKTLKFIWSFIRPRKHYVVTRVWRVWADNQQEAITHSQFARHDEVHVRRMGTGEGSSL